MQNLLVVVDHWNTAEASVQYSVNLARLRQAALHVLVCVDDPLIDLNRHLGFEEFQGISENMRRKAQEQARELLKPHADVVGEPEVKICWSSAPHGEIIDYARECEASLIVKHAGYHSLLAEFVHTPDDWQLLRYAECPVLMLGAEPRPPAVVVVAIDALDERPEHQRLSARALDEAYAMARGFDVPLRAVAVCPDPGYSWALAGTLPSYVEVTERLYDQARKGLEDMIRRFGVPCDEMKVLRGMVDQQLAGAMAGNGLLVLGGCSNRGVKGRLLGNVAEKVLHYVDGNVLVVV